MEILFFGGPRNIMFTIVPVIIALGFVLVIGTIIIRSLQEAKQWNRNNNSPILTVDATMVTKRIDVHHHSHTSGTNDMHHMSSSTTCYATFEVDSGDRIEFKIQKAEYGMLVEGDRGKLTFQGTRYLGFVRTRN